MKCLTMRSMQTVALAGLFACVTPINESENESGLFSISGVQLWPGGKVPVCFTGSYSSARTDLIKQLVAASWGRAAEGASSIHFTGWGVCPALVNGTERNGKLVVVLTTDSNMVTNTTGYNPNAATVITAGDSYWAYRAGVVHEFGHALGFTHEFDRNDTGDKTNNTCGWGTDNSGNTYNTPFDNQSVMNSTYPSGANGCNSLITETLSAWDVIGLRNAYPRNFAHLQDQGDEKADLDADWRYRFMPKDNRHDICARGPKGIMCATSNGNSFDSTSTWSTGFSDSFNWNKDPGYYETIRYPDINRDGRADVCGRSAGGISCALNMGSYFGPTQTLFAGFSDGLGWNYPQYWSTIRFPDVSGDGIPDVCGRASGGIYCAYGTGSSFVSPGYWSTAFSDANAWNAVQYYSTIRFLDLNNDKKIDICARGVAGIWCALSTGSSFGSPTLWNANFDDARGWNAPQYYSTIRFPDLNGDGKPDVCGRSASGISCALNTGYAFGTVSQWVNGFDDAGGWDDGPEYYSTIQYADVNGDHKADVCGRNAIGIACALSNGSSFGALTQWSYAFDDANQWNSTASYYSTIRLRDVDGDGKADVCGRAAAGIVCALSTGTAFGTLTYWAPSAFTNGQGWSGPEYYSTVRML